MDGLLIVVGHGTGSAAGDAALHALAAALAAALAEQDLYADVRAAVLRGTPGLAEAAQGYESE